MIDLPLHYASSKERVIISFYNRSRSLWLGGWWWSLRILRVTKFGNQSPMGLSGYEGKKHLIISRPLDAHCVFVAGGVSSVSLVGAMGCTWHISRQSLSMTWIIVRSSLIPFSPILKVFLVIEYTWVFVFCRKIWICDDGSFCFAKHYQWKFMKERLEQYDPHRFLELDL